MLSPPADVERCRRLIKERPRAMLYQDIANETAVPRRWLEEFARARHSRGRDNYVKAVLEFFRTRQG